MFDDIFSSLDHWFQSDSATATDSEELPAIADPISDEIDVINPVEGVQDLEDIENFWMPEESAYSEVWWVPDMPTAPIEFDGVGEPIEDADFWQPQSGQASCAVVAQTGIYESITGTALTEAEACRIAEQNGWFDPEAGTHPGDVGKLLEELGIPTTQQYDATLEDIATALEKGDKVIVGLDAHEIWFPLRDPITGAPVEQTNAGHAVWVTGINQEPSGSVSIVLNDTGTPDGQMKVAAAEDFLNAWEDAGNFLVVADAPEQSVWT